MRPRFVFSSFSLLFVSAGLMIIGSEAAWMMANYAANADVSRNAFLLAAALIVTTYVIIRSYAKRSD
jgi:hypothetical protein